VEKNTVRLRVAVTPCRTPNFLFRACISADGVPSLSNHSLPSRLAVRQELYQLWALKTLAC
jgi:hypothetical protein